MVFESILGLAGSIYGTIAVSAMGIIEKLSPGFASRVQGVVDVINQSGSAKALALLAVAGLVLGFVLSTIEMFNRGKGGCKDL